MDITTFLGIFSGFILMMLAIKSGGGLSWFVSVPSMMIVMGGTIATTLINYPLSDVLGVFRIVKNAFVHRMPDYSEEIAALVNFSKIARREGILALEKLMDDVKDPFMAKGIELAIDGLEPKAIMEMLGTELEYTEERHKKGAEIFSTMGTFAPAMGMLGTLIGLVQMLMVMDDPKSIGPAMAVALITTFYGSLLANLLFLPISGKLRLRSQQEVRLRQLVIEGIIAIQFGDNPRIIEQKLNVFLAPSERKTSFEELAE
ncbi:MAG: MotA/TolQ/ExbB proton channel family protein [Thermodesulfobacteriota bacterium]|nr:MotA/TolQ/ExbB proton channel family protein [Thermodesulfobacteriota bacterium]